MRIYCNHTHGGYFPNPANLNFYGSYRLEFNIFDRIFRRDWVKADPFISASGKVNQITCEEAIEKYVADTLRQKRTPTNYVALEVFPNGSYAVELESNYDDEDENEDDR